MQLNFIINGGNVQVNISRNNNFQSNDKGENSDCESSCNTNSNVERSVNKNKSEKEMSRNFCRNNATSVEKIKSRYEKKLEKNKRYNITWDLEEESEDINSDDLPYLLLKKQNEYLESIYKELDYRNKVESLHGCNSYLEFKIKFGESVAEKELHRASNCNVRLCPICMVKRSQRVYANVRKCYNYLVKKYTQSRFLFLTLTTRNVPAEDVKEEITNLLKGFFNLRRHKSFKDAFIGFFRSLEIVPDTNFKITKAMFKKRQDYYLKRGLSVGDTNPNFMMYNLHIHVLLHTTYDIYTGDRYITQSELTEKWAKACKLDYDPIVDIRSFKAKNAATRGKELAEVCKYSVKPSDYLSGNIETDISVVKTLDSALFHRRLFDRGGTFKDAYRSLKLDDEKETEKEKFEIEVDDYFLRYFYNFFEHLYKRF